MGTEMTTMQTKQEVLAAVTELLDELFEIDADKVKPEAKLYEDLDLDSIDAVDMVVRLKEITGKKIEPEDFKNVRTVDDVVESVHAMLVA